MPKINQEEYEVLKALDDKWKYLARNNMYGAKLEVHTSRPYKMTDSHWSNGDMTLELLGGEHLFQFIQWEDEEPYNISELIEEYLYDNRPKLFIDGQEQSFEFIEESEETEVKTLESIREEIWEEMLRLEDKRKDQWADIKYQTLREVLQKLGHLDEPEVLSQEWIDENKSSWTKLKIDGYYIPVEKLQNLLVPKQELPVIPQFVADWIEETKPYKSLRVAFEYIAQRKRDNYDDKLAFWVEEGNSETFARAWLDGYEIEQEPKYYAKIKGHENIGSNDKYWNYNTDMEELSIGDSEVHPNVISEYMLKATKDEWANLGINDDNADFVKIEELKEC